jgi:D-alanyl-D-alanine carboxypeptidase
MVFNVIEKLQERTAIFPRFHASAKSLTATAIMMLADEGRLSIDDEITTYLPGYPTHGKKITIEHLLNHTSGIASYTRKPAFDTIMTRDMSVVQVIDFFKNDPPDFAPGEKWRYNNSGYFLLGAIIEKVSGMPYARFVEQRIFVPLRMNDTAYEGYERGAALRAAGHTGTAGNYKPSAALSMTQPYAAGALVSTVDDLARWDQAVWSGKLLKPASWQKAFTPAKLVGGAPTTYGYGWMLEKLQGEPTIGHGGRINGYGAYAFHVPSERLRRRPRQRRLRRRAAGSGGQQGGGDRDRQAAAVSVHVFRRSGDGAPLPRHPSLRTVTL